MSLVPAVIAVAALVGAVVAFVRAATYRPPPVDWVQVPATLLEGREEIDYQRRAGKEASDIRTNYFFDIEYPAPDGSALRGTIVYTGWYLQGTTPQFPGTVWVDRNDARSVVMTPPSQRGGRLALVFIGVVLLFIAGVSGGIVALTAWFEGSLP